MKDKQIQVRCDEETFQRIKKVANEKNIALATFVRMVAVEEVKNSENQNGISKQ